MATVYKNVNGYKLEKAMGLQEDVRDEMNQVTEFVAARATSILAAHRDQGHAFIEVELDKGRVDTYVTLNDERGLGAALSIEYGKQGDPETGEGGSEGLFVLHRAAGLSPKRKR